MSSGGYAGDAGGGVAGILGHQLRPLRLQEGLRPGRAKEAAHAGAEPPRRRRGPPHLRHGAPGQEHPRRDQDPQRRGHPNHQRQEVAEDHHPHHARQRGVYGSRGLGNQGQGQGRPGAGGGRLSRHRQQTGVPKGQEAAGVPRPQAGEPPTGFQPLPPQRPAQVRDLRQGHDRCRGQERQVHLLRLPLPPEARQRDLQDPQAQRQDLREAHRR